MTGAAVTPTSTASGRGAADWALPLAAVVLLAVAASATGLHNGFAYDDLPIVRDNARVHELRNLWHLFREAYWPASFTAQEGKSAGLYRPLAVLGYAIQWRIGNGAPWVFHAWSVALYAAVSAAVYWLASQFLSRRAAIVGAALFAVHPVHVEAVANVVGQAELLAALFCVLGAAVYVRARRAGPLRWPTTLAVGALYATACFSKEHGILLLPLLVLAEWLIVPAARAGATPQTLATRIRQLAPHYAVLVAVVALFLWMRGTVPDVVAGQANTAVLLKYPWRVRFYTFLYVLREWCRLLFWPQRLAVDYSPQALLIPLRWTWSMLSGIVVGMGVLALALLFARRNRAASYAIAWTLATLSIASGLFVATGVLLAERTLFLPSVGVALLLGVGADWALAQARARSRAGALAVGAAVGLLVFAGAWRSAARQPVWRDNATLFAQAVVDAPLSYRAHYSYGGQLFEEGRVSEGERELRLAIRLFPEDPAPPDYLASRYMIGGMCEPAIPLLRQSLALSGRRRYTRMRLISCLIATGRYAEARDLSRDTMARLGADADLTRLLFVADSAAAAERRRPVPST